MSARSVLEEEISSSPISTPSSSHSPIPPTPDRGAETHFLSIDVILGIVAVISISIVVIFVILKKKK